MAFNTLGSAFDNLVDTALVNKPASTWATLQAQLERENIDTEVDRCESYAKSLKFFYMFGILAIYLLLLVRVVLWGMLLSTLWKIVQGAHSTIVDIDVEPQSETICVKHNHDCGETNNPCSSWLTRWRARIRGTKKNKTFIINTVGSTPQTPPTHICKQGNMYTYPCKTVNDLVHKFFTILLCVIVVETIYNGYLYNNDCAFTFKTIYGLPSYVLLILFITIYTIVLMSIRRIGDAVSSMGEDVNSAWSMFI